MSLDKEPTIRGPRSHHRFVDVPGYEGCVECEICKSFEGEIPTECPNRPMTIQEKDDVFKGRVDFRDGEWVKL
jgi:hypothetical protein